MSCFVRINTRLTHTETIKEAARELGYVVREETDEVRGYGSGRVKADIVLGTESQYDIGGVLCDDGTYEFIADWEMARLDQRRFVDQMALKYSYIQVLDVAKKKGFVVARDEVDEAGGVRLLLRKFV